MRRTDLNLPWPGVRARIGDISALIGGEDSRLTPQMRRVHQSRCARLLALELLSEQGIEAAAIGKGPGGEPIWPPGSLGSLSHTGHFAAAAVSRPADCAGLGIDIEPADPLPGETGTLILRAEEQDWVRAVGADEPAADRLVFCAKECVHKAIHPRDQTWLEFSEVRIRFDDSRQRFWPRAVSERAQNAFSGLEAEGQVMRVQGQFVVLLHLREAAKKP